MLRLEALPVLLALLREQLDFMFVTAHGVVELQRQAGLAVAGVAHSLQHLVDVACLDDAPAQLGI
ncbi:Uncharacterised protein [Bordetella pertussis]|nr:Uncharacterised protein [Bordetella pertussis]